MVNVSFLPDADADYQAAIAWYRARNMQAATRFEAAVADGGAADRRPARIVRFGGRPAPQVFAAALSL